MSHASRISQDKETEIIKMYETTYRYTKNRFQRSDSRFFCPLGLPSEIQCNISQDKKAEIIKMYETTYRYTKNRFQ